ncbi:MAG: PAS domain S-box protein [Bacteroidetes bacterium]|nr:PAS domain S-box protein [Bacteroidota bacterium]
MEPIVREKKGTTATIIPFTAERGLQGFDANAARHLSLETLGKSGHVFLSVWHNTTDGFRLCDGSGIIVAVNKAFCALFEVAESDVVGKHFTEVYAGGVDKQGLAAEYKQMFDNNEIKPRFLRRYQLHSGKFIESEVMSTYVVDEGGTKYMLTQFRDVTRERAALRALEESERRYRDLFMNSPMPMFQVTKDGKLVNANKALVRLLGYSSFYEMIEAEEGKLIYVNPEERTMVNHTLETRGYVIRAELQLRRKNGRILTVLETARAVRDEQGNVIEYEGVIEDITSRKYMEQKIQEYVRALEKSKTELSELNAQKDKILSILSHDLRSPFSSILGFCDILIKEHSQLTEEERIQFVQYIQEAAQDQLALVNKLLDWSRLETGRVKLERIELDLFEIVEKSIRSLQGLAHQKGIMVLSTLPHNVTIRGDEQMMLQVFNNLIGNALKFTPKGGLVTVELMEEQQNYWVIGVRDTGIGIPEADLPKLFKIEEKYTRKGLHGEKGTGLGLPVVHEIVLKHHGKIRVESKVGVGTVFILTLPKSCTYNTTNVLVVDDEHGVRVLHSRFIERVAPNANILHASDGKEAFQIAKEYHPKLVISDCDMPMLDGHDFVKLMKEDPETKDIPIIIISGHDSHANREYLQRHGVNEILTKPVIPEQVEELLRKYLFS